MSDEHGERFHQDLKHFEQRLSSTLGRKCIRGLLLLKLTRVAIQEKLVLIIFSHDVYDNVYVYVYKYLKNLT